MNERRLQDQQKPGTAGMKILRTLKLSLLSLLLVPIAATATVIDFESATPVTFCQVTLGGTVDGFTLTPFSTPYSAGFNDAANCSFIAPTANSGQIYMLNYNSLIGALTKDSGTFDLNSVFVHADARVGATTVRFEGLDGVGGNVLYTMDVIIAASWQQVFFPGWDDVTTFTWDSISPPVSNIAIDDFEFDVIQDDDGDGVLNDEDVCADTVIPEGVPTRKLRVNRFALTDADGVFDTVQPLGQGPQKSFTIEDTAGCSCEQIILAQELGKGHTRYGCSLSAMEEWVALVNPAPSFSAIVFSGTAPTDVFSDKRNERKLKREQLRMKREKRRAERAERKWSGAKMGAGLYPN